MQSAECWLKTQAVCKTFQPNEDTFNANVVIGNEESHNREDIKISRHTERKRSIPFHFPNNAILRGLNNCSPQKDGKNCEVNNENRKVAFTLAEGTTHVAHWKNSRKIAFTLAEVLITLGIIGVVAALTLPTLIQNYQKQVYVTQLKKVVNTMENNSRKILADEGVDSLFDTPLFTAASNNSSSYLLNNEYFEKHYKATKLPETSEYAKLINNLFSDTNLYNYYFDFGACISVVGEANDYGWNMLVDTNCLKQPNKIGYDRFTISFNKKGLVMNSEDDGFTPDLCDELTDIAEDSEDYEMSWAWGGVGCYHKIVEDGWQIKY